MLDKNELLKGPRYQDRGMKKWQGLILAEHREVLLEMFAEYGHTYSPPIQQTEEEIKATLQTAYSQQYKIWLAINSVDLNGVYREYKGFIQGHDGDMLMINHQMLSVQTIRCVEFIEAIKYWE